MFCFVNFCIGGSNTAKMQGCSACYHGSTHRTARESPPRARSRSPSASPPSGSGSGSDEEGETASRDAQGLEPEPF